MSVSRRELLQMLGAGSLAAGLGMTPGRLMAQENDGAPDSSFAPNIKYIEPTVPGHAPARFEGGKVIQPARELTVMSTTDVLVVGGGPAGFAAAVAAARTGAKVALIERYGCLGGLWSGGLVLVLPGMNVKENGKLKRVSRGLLEELLTRLSKLDPGVINFAPDKNGPTADPEALKYMMDQMAEEAKVDLYLHCWGVDAIMDGKTIKGAIFESKSGRQAILAKVVIDASGDGDIFAAAGASYKQITHAIGLVHRLGNVDRVEKGKTPPESKFRVANNEPVKSAQWVNVMGPKGNALDVRDLTKMEMMHRKSIWNHVQKMRATPGYEKVFELQTASQLGVRASRLLAGCKMVTYQDMLEKVKHPDAVGVGGSDSLKHNEWPIPYGALVSAEIENMLAAGRCISTEAKMIDAVRLIPACMVTGHAAGVAAALAAKDGVAARAVEVGKVQKVLREQGAYLG